MGGMDWKGNAEPSGARAKAAARAASWQAWGAVLGIAAGYAAPWVTPWMFRSIFAMERSPAALTAVGAGLMAWAGMLGYGGRIWRREVAGKEEEKGWRRGWKLLAFLWGFLLVGIALLVAGFVGFPGFMALAVAVGMVSRKSDGGEDFWDRHHQAEVRFRWGVLGLMVSIFSEMVVDRRGWAQTWAGMLPFVLAVAGVALILAGLWDVAGRGRRGWVGGAVAALAVLVAAQALSGMAVQRAQEEADGLLREVLARCGEVEAGRPLEEVRPPVAEAEDRLAGLADLQEEREDWVAFAGERMRREQSGRLHPEGAEEREYVRGWVAGHPGLVAVAEALADPGYRSCLEGGTIAGEAAAGVAETSWLEPRMEAARAAAGILELRARLAFGDGNAAGGMADVGRLRRLAERMEREAWTLDALAAEGMRDAIVRNVLAESIGAWPEEALEEAVREEAGLAARGGEDWRGWALQKIAIGDLRCLHGLPGLPKSFAGAQMPGLPDRAPGRTGTTRASDFWTQRDRCALLRDWAWTLDALEGVEAAPPGEEREAAWAAYAEEAERRAWGFPLLTGGIGAAKGWTWRRLVYGRRTRAEVVRAAVAVERWRRSHGGEVPASLEEVPPVPRDAWSGEVLAYEPGPMEIPEERLVPMGGNEECVFPACEVPGWRLGWPALARVKEGRGRERMVRFVAGE